MNLSNNATRSGDYLIMREEKVLVSLVDAGTCMSRHK